MSRSAKFTRFSERTDVSGDLKHRSVISALATGAGGATDFVLRIASTLVLARLLVPEDFGLVAMVTAIARMAERFSTLGLSTATVQAPAINKEQCSNLFWVNIAAGLFFAVCLIALSPVISRFYEDERLKSIALAISLTFVWTGLTVQHEALLRRQMKLGQIAGNQLTASFLSLALALALAFFGFGYWALVWRDVARTFFLAVGAWVLCPWIPSAPNRRADMGRFLVFGRDLTLTQILMSVTAQLDNLLIGKFAGAVQLGLYRQAYNLLRAPVDHLITPITAVAQPGLSMLQFEPDRYRRYYQRVVFVVGFVTIPLGVFTALYAEDIVLLALGEKWLGSTVFVRIFGLLASVWPALATSATVMVTCGHSGRFLLISVVHSAALLGLMLVGIQWGPVGIASAHLTTTCLFSPWMLSFSFRGSPVTVGSFWRSVLHPSIASLTMVGTLALLRNFVHFDAPQLSLIVGVGTAVGVYFVTLELLPGGRDRLHSLGAELFAAMRRRSSDEVTTDVP